MPLPVNRGTMIGWFYTALLLGAVGFVLVRGGWEERLIVTMMLAAGFGTFFIVTRLGHHFKDFSLLLVANEALLLVACLFVAYRSNRFWPLLVASLELATFVSLLAPLFGRNLVSYAMGVAQGLWAYPQMVILVLAVIRQRNRGKWFSLPSS